MMTAEEKREYQIRWLAERLQSFGQRPYIGDCLQCGLCETRCPFDVKIRENMQRAKEVFGY